MKGDLSAALTEEVASLKKLPEFSNIEDPVLAGFVFCFYECEFEAGAQIMQQAKLPKGGRRESFVCLPGFPSKPQQSVTGAVAHGASGV